MGHELPLQNAVFTLLFRIGVASSIAALIARSTFFQRVLQKEERELDERLWFVLLYGPPVALGVLTRILLGYRAADVSLEGALVAGLVGGRTVGMMVGTLAALPAFFNQELLSLPFNLLCGAAGGVLREIASSKDQVWRFGPFFFLSVPRSLSRLLRRAGWDWQLLPLAACIGLEVGRVAGGRQFPGALYYLGTQPNWQLAFPVFSTIFGVTLSLMIWNNTRIQIKLRDQEQLLLAARMEALSSQINPHFLFNTLNTVAALIRADPEMARELLVKLSHILRRLLRKHENFVSLREELEFIDNYLDIEMARFGPEKLQFFKEIDEPTLDAIVPSMLLQPIIENSIRHGLSPRIEGGQIHLRTERRNGRIRIEVKDNGVGIPEGRVPEIFQSGIGISNVHERLKVLYGTDFLFEVTSEPGQGTSIRIEVPELSSA